MRTMLLLATLASTTWALKMELHRHDDMLPVKRDRDSLRQLRRLDDGTYQGVPLNLGMGTHYAWIYAGNPPQRASVIIDTGSHITAFPCSGCHGCGQHTDTPFDIAKSSTLQYPQCTARPPFSCSACSRENQCHISQSYTEGSSWDAVIVEDHVWLGDTAPTHNDALNTSFGTRFMFGCQKKVTGLFVNQVADGIMGVSDTASTNIVRKLYQEKKIPANVFSLCLTPNGGTMALGSVETAHQREPLQYAMVSTANNGWYAVHVESLRLGNKPLDVDISSMNSGRHRVIVDSGTTDSYFPTNYASIWNAAFEAATGQAYMTDDGSCKGYAADDVASFPPFEISLRGIDGTSSAILRIPASQYIVANNQGQLCSTIFFTEANGGVIGANMMIGHEFVFDLDAQRVGFAPANCDYRGLELETKFDVTTNATALPVLPHPTNSSMNATLDVLVPTKPPVAPQLKGASTHAASAPFAIDFSSTLFVFVGVACAVIVLGIAYRLVYRKRSRADQSWTSVPTLQDEAEEEEHHGVLPDEADADAPKRNSLSDDDDDEFFDSEGYVMSPRSLRKCKEAFEP
ncbi:hypothetical protein SDRG_13486 [Saprolegnia diclina VS20]|uniref:Peptidase A1 domain-containing protein n=1 Tax=Saprolegnia diclina (strain VS20) TaxID=1156394 RepID=T0Q5T8_SAPDV|nr:hypothetical protein SDRG_13486 [Saprolegnia diclina VS20]EQC28805.1 hypothetical protein SDRG_13486 [Saprolegnia diclina VS20]|eukprot:XP_008617800.1 hypothetical protein SDRG_13486 [Saprolegnia diclina VS20]